MCRTKIRILLAEDHGAVRKALHVLLERQPEMEIVGQAADGREAVRLAEETRPDIVIMDIGMPVLNGIEATAEIVKRIPETGVIIVTMHSDQEYVRSAREAGARGYLLKAAASGKLVRAIHAVTNGGGFFHSESVNT